MRPSAWPVWLQTQLIGLAWAVVMWAVLTTRTLLPALVFIVLGVVFGLVFQRLMRAQQRRLYGDLTQAELATAGAAVRAADPPDDPRLHEAALRLAQRWASPPIQRGHQVIIFAFFAVVSLQAGLVLSRLLLLGVVVWPVVGWLALRTEKRRKEQAERYLQVVSG